jgi:DNA mismatch repair protein MutS2
MLAGFCISPMGERYVGKLRFRTRFGQVKELLGQVEEFRQLLLFGKTFPAQDYFDLVPELNRIKTPGTYILKENLFDLKSSLRATSDVISYLKDLEAEKFPLLLSLTNELDFDAGLIKELDRIIDDRGNILDSASDKLREIRRGLVKLSGEVDRSLRKVLKSAIASGWVNPNDELTLRNGRLVIPVPATHKRRIRGFIHDESATGHTVFIEPAEALEVNNEILELHNAEKREVIKILTKFTERIRPEINHIVQAYHFLGLVDFIRAKAKLALKIEAGLPILNDFPVIEWFDARHPLLFLAHQVQKKPVEPLALKLDNKSRILIISGPNAGGKSVCLKTVGLLQYMLQCGLLVPMRETSETGIFDDIFIDIGDEQSIENDLSTYTSHLKNMKFFSTRAGKGTLFLIDEFGTGTEPQLGGAIAEAVLEELNQKKAFGVITTHYANLKLLADKTAGLINGAMLFDTRKMQPLFRLQMGSPGSSFAFEIARKTGFPWYILRNAERKVGKSQVRFDRQLQQLEIEKKEVADMQKQLTVAEKEAKLLKEKYAILLDELQSAKAKLMKEARLEAKSIILGSNKLIENTIREIKEAQADKEKTREIREKLKSESDKIKEKSGAVAAERKTQKPKKKSKPKTAKDTLRILPGNRVRIPPQITVGEVIEVSGNEAIVGFGSLKMRLPVEKLVNVGEEELHQKVLMRKSNYGNILNDLNAKMANFKLSLDLRGQRAEEAVANLQKYIDEALLLGVRDVKILHGKGNGILREIIRDQLHAMPEVKKYSDEHVERGGSGITVVILK